MENGDYIRSPDNQFYDQLSAPIWGRRSTSNSDSDLEEALRLSADMYSHQDVDLDEIMLMSVQSHEQEQFMRELVIQEEERVKNEAKMRQDRFDKLVPLFYRLWKLDSQNRDVYEYVLAFIEAYKASEMDFIEVDPDFMDRLNKVSTLIRVDKALMDDLKTCFIV